MNYGEIQFNGRYARTIRRDLEAASKALVEAHYESLEGESGDRSLTLKLNRARDHLERVFDEADDVAGNFAEKERNILLPVMHSCDRVLTEIPRIKVLVPTVPTGADITEYTVRNPQNIRDNMSAVDFRELDREKGRLSAFSVGSERTSSPHGSFKEEVERRRSVAVRDPVRSEQEREDERFALELAAREERELGKEVERVNCTPLRGALAAAKLPVDKKSRNEGTSQNTRPKQIEPLNSRTPGAASTLSKGKLGPSSQGRTEPLCFTQKPPGDSFSHPPTQSSDSVQLQQQLAVQAQQIADLTIELKNLKSVSQGLPLSVNGGANSPMRPYHVSHPSSAFQSRVKGPAFVPASNTPLGSNRAPLPNLSLPPPQISQDSLKYEVVREISAITNDRVTAQSILLNQRPPESQKFSGDDLSIDFESFLGRFENVMNQVGITPEMILSEMHHWFRGSASIIVTQFQNTLPASEAISKIKEKLKKEFGNKKFTARQLMDSLLKGKPLNQSCHGDIRVLLLSLGRLYDKACETGREASFNTRETYKDILNKKMPHLIKGWGKKTAKNARDNEGSSYRELSFKNFLQFCSDEASNAYCSDTFIDSVVVPSVTPTNPTSTLTTTTKQVKFKPKNSLQIAATDVTTATSGGEARQSTKLVQTKREDGRGGLPKGDPAQSKDSKTGEIAGGGGKGCSACGFNHQLAKCRTFARKNNEEKVALIRSRGVCFLCLRQGHMSNVCPDDGQINCDVCQGRHHTLLHRKRPEDDNVIDSNLEL